MSYEVVCNCGQTLRGDRQGRHQVLSCPGCGEKVFVLPLSPLAALSGAVPLGVPSAPRRWWRAPLLAAVASLLALLVAFVVAWPFLIRPAKLQEEAKPDEKSVPHQMEAGRRALGEGKFRMARQLLNEAIELRDESPDSLSPADSRQLNQLHRQADLLARLLPVSLDEVARQGRLVRDPAEWDLQMDEYRGRSVIFDDVVKRDDRSRPVLGNHVVRAGDEIVRVALEDLTLLRDLPLDDQPRLIFGARLVHCHREEGGSWVVRFEPDSGVLLTHLDATAVCLPVPPDQALEQTLARQQRWLDEQAVVQPARP